MTHAYDAVVGDRDLDDIRQIDRQTPPARLVVRPGISLPGEIRVEAAIHEYLEASNQAPKPFVWTAPAQDILAKVERAAKTHAIVQNR